MPMADTPDAVTASVSTAANRCRWSASAAASAPANGPIRATPATVVISAGGMAANSCTSDAPNSASTR